MKPEDIERIKDLLPTSLGSAEIRERYAREILQRSVFSARMENMRYLAKIRDVCTELAAGRMNAAKAKEQLLGVLSFLHDSHRLLKSMFTLNPIAKTISGEEKHNPNNRNWNKFMTESENESTELKKELIQMENHFHEESISEIAA